MDKSQKSSKDNGRPKMCYLLVWCCVIICHRIILCINYFLNLTAVLISSNTRLAHTLRECFQFSVGRPCGECFSFGLMFKILYQFVWNNWKQPKTFMSKWKKSKRMSHLQQSLGLKWLFLKGYENTRSSLLYPSYKKKKKRKGIIGHNAAGSQSNPTVEKNQQEYSLASYLRQWIRQLGEGGILTNHSLVKFCSGTSLNLLADGILLSAGSQRAQLAILIL